MEENAIGMPDSFFERLNKKNGFADDTTAAPVDSGTTPVATDKTIPSGMPDSFFEKLNSQQHYADTNNWAENYKRYIPQAEENPSAWDNIKNNFFAIKDASEASMYGGLELMSRQGEKSGNANFANFIKAAGMYYGADPNWLVKNMQENEAQSQEELKRVWLDPKMGQFNATDMFADPKSFFQTQLPQMLGGSATLMAAGMGIAKGVQTGVMALGAAGAPFTFGGSAVAAGFIGGAVASAISRPIESLMEGYGAFDEAYSELAKKYPNATHQQLTDMAMPVFNKTFDENMQLQVLDAVQLGLSIIPVTAWGKGALSGTGAIGRMARRADMMRQRYNVAAHIGETAFQMGTEGWEEGRQMQITNEAINKYVGTDKPTSWYDMLNTKEGQSAVSGGAFMGGMMESPGILKLAYNKLTGVGDDIKTKPYEDIKQKQTALFYGNIAKSVNEGTTNEMMQAINKFGRSGVLATVETDDADSRNKSSIAEAKRLGDEVAEQVGVFSRMKEQYPDVSEKGLVRMFQNNALIRNNANALKTLSEDNVTDAPIIQRINAQNEALNKENNDIIAGKDVWETPSHEDPFADPEKDKEADIPFDSVEEVEAARLKEIEALQQIPTDGMTDEQMYQRAESLAEINSRYEDLKNRLTEKINDAKGHYENQRVLTEMLQNNIPVEGTIQKAYGMHYDFVTQDGKTVRFYNQATHDVVDDNDFNGSAFLVLRKAEQGLDGTYKDEKGNYLFRSVLGDKDHAERIEVHTTDKDGNDKYLGNVAVSNAEDYNIARDRAKAARMEKLEGEDGEGEGFSVSDEQLSGVKTTSNEQAAEAQSYGFRNAYHALNSVNKYFDADYTDYANIPKEDLALVGRIKQEEAASATTTTPPPDSPPDSPPPSEPDTPPAPPTPPPTPPPAPQSPSPATAPSGTTSSTDSGNAGYERTERSFDKVNVGDNITHNGKQGKVFAKVRPKGSLSHPVVLAKDAEGVVFRVSESEYKGTERGESDNVLKTNGKLLSYRNDIGRIVVDEENNVIFEGNKSSVELGKTTDEEFSAKSIDDVGISYVNENSLDQAILVGDTVYVKGEEQELVRINYDKNDNVVSYTYKNSKGHERTNRNSETALDIAIQKNNQEFDKSRKGASDEVKQRDEEHISGVVKAEYGDSIGYILETMPDEVYDTFDIMEAGITRIEKDAVQDMVLRTLDVLDNVKKKIADSGATKKEKGSALSMIEKFEKDLNKYYGKLDKQSKVSAKDVAKANTGENNKGDGAVQTAEQKTEAYHADKAAGKETELVKAVEEAIGKSKEPISEPTNKAEGVSSNSSEGNSALRDVESKKADIERRQGLNGVEEIIFSNPNFRLEGFEIDGNYWNVVTSTDRAKVLVNINGVIVPFYLTTGQAGKGLVPGWYPFFGIGKDGWLNKTDKSDMETYYERYWGKETADIVKSISEELNSFYGTDPSTFKNDGDPNATSRPLTTLADKVEDYINSKLNYTPAINNADARKTLRSNVEQLGREINAKYDAELKAVESLLSKEQTPTALSDVESEKKQIEDFGVAKEDVEATHGLLGRVFDGLKKAGLTAAKNVGEWVGIGKGTEKPYSLKIDGKDTQVKNVQPEVVNGFYSPLEKIITESKFDKLPAKQWAEKYANSEEAKWTGLTDWLAQQQGSISKADIQNYLKDNRIKIVEVVKGSQETFKVKGKTDQELYDRYRELERTGRWKVGEWTLEGIKDDRNGFLFDFNPENEAAAETETKFSQYQLEGEKENYKEIMIVLPREGSMKKVGDYTVPSAHKYGEDLADNRRVVHLRMNTRTDADGNKVLFLEEVQSDWGQKGKKEGFEQKNNYEIKESELYDGNYSVYKNGVKVQDGFTKEGARNYVTQKASNESGIASAPFVTDTNAWVKLGLKVALKEAVKQGADKIAWTTGEQQNERYDLSKQVDWINAEKTNKGDYKIEVGHKDNRPMETQYLKENELEANLGKELATKIINDGGGMYRGLDLKVGGKGMKGFYGSPTENKLGIVGNVAKSLFKQEPKTVDIDLSPAFAKKQFVVEYSENEPMGNKWLVKDENGGVVARSTSESGANLLKETFEDRKKQVQNTSTQHSIDITPELKASVEGGQPLFKDAEAQYRIESGKNIIDAIKDFDGSPRATVALTHEIMHPTVVAIIDGAKEGNEVGKKHTETIVSEFNKANPKNKVTVEDLIKSNDAFKDGTTSKQYRAVQEFIAKSWEKYHREGGKGFSEAFQKVLDQITKAFQSVYKSLSGKQLTPELRKMFDDILGKEELSTDETTPTKEVSTSENKIKSWIDKWEELKKENDNEQLDLFYNKVKVALNGYAQGKGVVDEFTKLKSEIEQFAKERKAKPKEQGNKERVSSNSSEGNSALRAVESTAKALEGADSNFTADLSDSKLSIDEKKKNAQKQIKDNQVTNDAAYSLISRALEKVDGLSVNNIFDLAKKISNLDNTPILVEHIAEAIQYEVGRVEGEKDTFSLSIDDAKDVLLNWSKDAEPANKTRMDEIGIVGKSYRDRINKLKVAKKQYELLDDKGKAIIKTFLNRYNDTILEDAKLNTDEYLQILLDITKSKDLISVAENIQNAVMIIEDKEAVELQKLPPVKDPLKNKENTEEALRRFSSQQLSEISIYNRDVIVKMIDAQLKKEKQALLSTAFPEIYDLPSKTSSMRLNEKGEVELLDKNEKKISSKKITKDQFVDIAIQIGNNQTRKDASSISETYHKAKADGSNPELVKAVEELLGKPKETSPTPNSKGEGTEVKYQIEESRDEPLASVNPALAEHIRQRMQRLFPSVALFSDKASFEAAAKKVSKGVTFSSAYIGAAIKNLVYVDAEKALQHTEIHEYAHIYWDALPADHPLKVSLLEKFGGNEEATIDAIGRAGTIIMENELDIAKSGFFEKWLKKFWAAVKGVFTSKSIEQAFAERLLTNADEVTEENITSGVVKYMKMKSSAKYSELSEKAVKGIEKIIGKKISSLTFPEYYKHISTEIKPNDFKQWKMLSPQKFLEKMYGIVSPVSTLSPSNKAVFMKQYREYLDDYNWAENNVWTRFASGSMTLTVKEIEDLYMEAYKRKSYGTKDAVNFLADLYSKAVMYKNMQQEIKGDTFNKPFAKMSFDMMSGHEITDLSGSEFVSGKYSLLSPDRVKETILQGREKLYREVQRNATIKEDALKNDFDAIWKRVKDLKSDLRKIVDKTGTYFIDRNSSAYKALRGGTAADRALADLLDMHYKYESAYGGLSMEKGKYRVPVARMDFGGLAKKFGFKEGMRRYFAKPSKYDNVIIDVRSLGLSKPLMTLKQARQEMVKGSNAIYPFQMLKLTKKVDALTKEAYKQFNSGRHANGDIVTTEDLSGSRYGVSFVKDDESSEDLKVSMMLYHYANIENESYDLLSPYSMYIQKYLGRKDKPNMLKWVKMLDDDLIKGESPTSNLGVYAKYVQALTNYTHWLQLGFNIAGMPFNAFAGFAQSVREIGFRNTLRGLRRVIGSLTVGGGAGVVNAKAISIMEKLHIVSLSKDLEMSVTSKIGKGISKIAFLPVSFVEYINHAYSFIGAMDESEWERVKALPANASAEDYTKAMGGNERVDELHTLTQKINGAYSKYSRRGINKTAEGRALMQFKNWLPDVIFAHLTVSQLNEAGEDLYGEYQSGIATSIKNTVWNKTIIPMFKDKSIAQAKKNWETLSEHEQMQVGKAMRQLVILGGMALWIASLDDRDDKELKRMLKRAMGDVTYIFDVSNMQFLFDNTVPVFGTIKNLLGLVAEVFSTATGNPSVYEKRQGSHMRGDLKLPVMIENQTPVVNKISKLVNEGD